jgi:6,7-dimethyl-8-ribityllumazine synthase
MSSQTFQLKNTIGELPDTTNMRFGLVVSEWNNHITDVLLQGAIDALRAAGVSDAGITVERVPGSFELIFGASQMAKHGYVDAVIAIGCVIRGDTPHFDYICEATSHGLAELNVTGDKPVIFGLITVNTPEQAQERAGGKLGNKGEEFAWTAIKMVDYARKLQN